MSELKIANERAIRVMLVGVAEPMRRDLLDRLGRDRRLLVKTATGWEALRRALEEEPFDVALIAADVDDASPIEINKNIRTLFRDPPATILLGGEPDAPAIVKAFRCGFADCVPLQDGRDGELRDAIQRAAGGVAERRQQMQQLRDLERMAQRDTVTGLANRYFLEERMRQLLEIGKRHGARFGVALIRIDQLDRIRGTFGAKVGDAVLLAFARHLQDAARKSATHGRFGDDTFLYLLEQDVTEESAAGARSRLTSSLAFQLDLDNVSLWLAASVASAIFPQDGTSIAEVLAKAEARLAEARPGEGEERPLEVVALPPGASPAPAETAAAPEATVAVVPGPEPVTPPPVDARRWTDRRNTVRRRCLKRGVLVLNQGFSTINCLVRDLSDTGARIEVEGRFDAQSTFELRLVESGQQFKAEKRWSRGNFHGLRFLS